MLKKMMAFACCAASTVAAVTANEVFSYKDNFENYPFLSDALNKRART
jgi:hypothetical protein